MPFNLAPEKILVLLVFALVFLGPDKLPEAARKIGEMVGHARRLSGGLQGELRQAIDEPLKTFTREFAAGEQQAISAGDGSATSPVDADGARTDDAAAEHAPSAVDMIEPGIEPSVPIAASPLGPIPASADEPVAAPAPAKPALPSWVFPGGSRGNGPGFH